MPRTKVTPVTINSKADKGDKEPRKAGGFKVQKFSDFVIPSNHVNLQDLDGQTIYIVKLEPLHSESFGDGYKIHFKDLPNAKDTYTASPFSKVLVPVLDGVYQMTNNGARISLTSPIQAKVVMVGRVLTLE